MGRQDWHPYLTITIEQYGNTNWFCARAAELPGLVALGETVEEAVANVMKVWAEPKGQRGLGDNV